MRIKVDYYCCVNLIPLVAVLHRSVFINAISLPHLITEIKKISLVFAVAIATLGIISTFNVAPKTKYGVTVFECDFDYEDEMNSH